jgi:hypothetical protein
VRAAAPLASRMHAVTGKTRCLCRREQLQAKEAQRVNLQQQLKRAQRSLSSAQKGTLLIASEVSSARSAQVRSMPSMAGLHGSAPLACRQEPH